MKFKTIASSSRGNCYLLETEDGSLLIEAGIPIKNIKKAMNFDFSKVLACVVSHEHLDHSKAAKDIAKLGIDVMASRGTLEALNLSGYRFGPMKPKETVPVGNFKIMGFDVEHDAAEPFGFLISYKDKRLLFATDTYYLRYKFKGLTHIVIECNYVDSVIEDNLENGTIARGRALRTARSHFSLDTLIDFFKANDLSKVEEVHLIHLSDDNSSEDIVRREIRKVYKGRLFIARDILI